MSSADLEAAEGLISNAMLGTQLRLRAMLARLRGGRGRGGAPSGAQFVAAVLESVALRDQRASQCPPINYPRELPVVAGKAAIAQAIRENQVCLICGETGSGKTTQIPKICLELGRGIGGFIGHTQPRRIAARTVAERIASELGTTVGAAVGFKIRFTEEVSSNSYIKVMTDGILLAEIRRDRDLRAYDTIIIDEAHERSLNIDFLLGYLKRLLPRRPDLKLIITSATLDPERIAAHFDGAVIVKVSGRTYPVELRYRPLVDSVAEPGRGDEGPAEGGIQQGIKDALHEAMEEGPGDVLVFLAGEREIRDTADALERDPRWDVEVLPLHARLNSIRQAKVFRPHGQRRRVVLATNVAETSVTVPGIRFVIDTGRARISRYSYRTKVQRLPVEPIAQASACQRAGRCGRIGPGICFRLYDEADFEGREPFTVPEIQRTNLASVILQLAAAGLGPINEFPFVDPPDQRYVRDGYRLLHDLGALDASQRLTAIGRKLARLPVDPQLARMIVGAHEHGCVAEVLVIASVLSVGDPRDRSIESREAANQTQERLADPRSDFMTYLNLWQFYRENAEVMTRGQIRRLCKEYFLLPGRMREWVEVHRQLVVLAREIGIRPQAEPATYGRVHRAVLTGLLSFVGHRDVGREYRTGRGSGFVLSKGSRVSPKGARWLVAAEVVETSRLFVHTAGRVRPEWVERAAGDTLRRTYFDVHWDARRGEVMAFERVTLHALTLIPKRRVRYEPVDPEDARSHFISAALLAGEMDTEADFRAHNDALAARIRGVEQKIRRLGLVVEDAQLFAFYDLRVPAGVASRRAFERWHREHPEQTATLCMKLEDLLREGAGDLLDGIDQAFPDDLEVSGLPLRLSYVFEPSSAADGVTAHVPLPLLHQLSATDFDWIVPGLRREKIIALIRTLPKHLRKRLVPVPTVVDALLETIDPSDGGLLVALERCIETRYGVDIPRTAWRPENLPDHLAMTVALAHGEEIVDQGRDFDSLQFKYAVEAQESFRRFAGKIYDQRGLTGWTLGSLPLYVDADYGGMRVRGYPGLEDHGASVALRLFETPWRAARASRSGLRRLFMLQMRRDLKVLSEALPDIDELCLNYFFVPEVDAFGFTPRGFTPGGLTAGRADRGAELRRSVLEAAVDEAFLKAPPAVWDSSAFERALARGRGQIESCVAEVCQSVGTVLRAFRKVREVRAEREYPDFALSLSDIDEQLRYLVFQGFVSYTPLEALREMPRYLEALRLRLQKLSQNHARDERMVRSIRALWESYWASYRDRRTQVVDERAHRDEFRWMLEELRISAFAQEVGTRYSVSVRRCEDLWRERLPIAELDAESS